MKKMVLAAVALLALAGCADNEAETAIKRKLNDPDSAKFSQLTAGASKGDVCGYVNAKNRMGGYVGETPFFYRKSALKAEIVAEARESDFRQLWLAIRAQSMGDAYANLLAQCELISEWKSACGKPYPGIEHEICGPAIAGGSQLFDALRQRYDR